jgi:Ca-activated chloride channel homolog
VIHFAHPYMLLALLALPAFAAMFSWADRERRLAMKRFAASGPTQVDVGRRRTKRICVLAAIASLILALSQPVWTRSSGASSENTGDVVFLLDVSRSMLSADVPPTRLARAKSIIGDLAGKFQGERVALVAFAGAPAVQCPLTVDHAFFESMLEGASPDSVARGGTRIGDAIQFSLDSVFDNVVRARKQLVILTDGGDQDSLPSLAAQTALTRGVQLLVIGIGDEENGALVPTSGLDPTPIRYRGETVRTKLEQGLLRTMASAGSGVYLAAAAGPLDTSGIYQKFIAAPTRARARESEKSALEWLLLLAIALLAGETLVSDRRARAATLALVLIANLTAQTPAEWVAKGNAAYRDAHWETAADSYELAAQSAPVSPQVFFNMGAALYRMQRYGAASDAFGRAAAAAPGTPLEAMSKLGQANCAYREAMDAPPRESERSLRRVLIQYDDLPGIPDARFNAGVVTQRLADLQKRLSVNSPAPLSANKKVYGPHDIVHQGGVPRTVQRQSVDRDW